MNITVFCGSSFGQNPIHNKVVYEFGKTLAKANHTLIYGGGSVGLMGTLANSVMEHGGEVIGVIPKHLYDKEVGHNGITQLHIVKDMHERKALMAELGEAFVALSGGAGTFEEIFEVWTWAQLGHHQKPVAFLNTQGFYDKLFEFLLHVKDENFIRSSHYDMLLKDDNAEKLLEKIYNYTPPSPKWQKN